MKKVVQTNSMNTFRPSLKLILSSKSAAFSMPNELEHRIYSVKGALPRRRIGLTPKLFTMGVWTV